jgi:hypothetical protein
MDARGTRPQLAAKEREALISAAMLAALVDGPIRPKLGRWIRAWRRLVHAYCVEGDIADAQRAARFARHLERCSRNSGLCRAVR